MLRFMVEEAVGKSKGIITNRNELGVELESEIFKVQSSKIRVVVCVNKFTCR
jgi:hypothetical protein